MSYEESVFLNCPFDEEYRPLFHAAVFAISECGFTVRCALERMDASEIRIQKIYKQIGSCKYGIHDLSRVQVDKSSKLPRFNMPLEFGVFLGAKFLGDSQQVEKMCLVFDEFPFRYQTYISDIAGQDISCHQNDPKNLIIAIRNWFAGLASERLASGSVIWERYQRFQKELAGFCEKTPHKLDELTYLDYVQHVKSFVKQRVDILQTGNINRWGESLNDPPLSHIREAIVNLSGGSDSYVILIKSGGGFSFLQVHGSNEDGFDLEYQDGSTHEHYKCAAELREEDVISIFQAYRTGDEAWKSKFTWQKHKWW